MANESENKKYMHPAGIGLLGALVGAGVALLGSLALRDKKVRAKASKVVSKMGDHVDEYIKTIKEDAATELKVLAGDTLKDVEKEVVGKSTTR